jgi:hypothetical protein
MVGATLNFVHISSRANYPSVSHDQPPPFPFIQIHRLALKSLSHHSIRSIDKSDKPPNIVTFINAHDQVVTKPKKVYSRCDAETPPLLSAMDSSQPAAISPSVTPVVPSSSPTAAPPSSSASVL